MINKISVQEEMLEFTYDGQRYRIKATHKPVLDAFLATAKPYTDRYKQRVISHNYDTRVLAAPGADRKKFAKLSTVEITKTVKRWLQFYHAEYIGPAKVAS